LEKIALIQQRIDSAIMAIANSKAPRRYLGCSSIGEECDRKIWYSFHEPIRVMDPRIHRIFDLGHLLESYCISMLKHAGYEVYHDDGSGQYGFIDEEVAGHIDAVINIDGLAYLLEIKTANDKRFAEMVKNGVAISDPVYYVQMQTYMKYMELDQAIFMAINKNTSALHMEIVKYEKIKADYAINRGKEIVRGAKEEAQRKYSSKAFYKCKFCNYKDVCWGGPPEPTEEMPALTINPRLFGMGE
jgi:CRISPR/Cas system-associated exonuclease Cas4 (RecB family)